MVLLLCKGRSLGLVPRSGMAGHVNLESSWIVPDYPPEELYHQQHIWEPCQHGVLSQP